MTPDIAPIPLPAYLLAGGQSRRFGSDKARATVEGVPLIVRLAEQLRPIADSITVIADKAGRYADLGLTTIGDIHPGQGPVAGLHTALHHADAPWLLLVSCDLLELRPHWLEALWHARTDGAHTQAVAFHEQHWQPFPGLYHQSLLAAVERRLAAGDLRMQRLLDVTASAVSLPSDWPAVAQVNTPEALVKAIHEKRGT